MSRPVSVDLLQAAAPAMFEALTKIATGAGYYGAQAREYKEIARGALLKAGLPVLTGDVERDLQPAGWSA